MNDAALIQAVEAARNGDERAYEALFRGHKDSVYSLAMHFAGDPELAADLTQEAFVRAWERLPTLRDPAAFSGWLRTMTVNLVRDHFRGARDEEALDGADPLPSGEDGPSRAVERSEQDRAVREAVLRLPEHQRTVVTMHHLEGIPVTEIARMLGLPKGTVVSRLARGRENLRRRLAPYIDSAEER
ncbi:MAG: sigma-70 family RNA polymerase sigma factor [Armatimonadota bacterium]|nr:sigma-70 family RNA polymerase sigma factor [Armatimonadota bacterium]